MESSEGSKDSVKKAGVVLMTYGSATTSADVQPYFDSIYRGKAPDTVVQEFVRRYDLIGRSPLIEITEQQAAHVEKELGEGYVVRAGMRHSNPSIRTAVAQCKEAGATSVLGVILAPQIAQRTYDGYVSTFMQAAEELGYARDQIRIAQSWETEPHFIQFLAEETVTGLQKIAEKEGTALSSIPVIFTTHSLPKQIVDSNPEYLEQLERTISAVREKLPSDSTWYAAYQSAGHSPEPWLTPDVKDILPGLISAGKKSILVVPIQFLADHLEILYDLDIALKDECDEYGIVYNRIPLPNTDERFIRAIVSIVLT